MSVLASTPGYGNWHKDDTASLRTGAPDVTGLLSLPPVSSQRIILRQNEKVLPAAAQTWRICLGLVPYRQDLFSELRWFRWLFWEPQTKGSKLGVLLSDPSKRGHTEADASSLQ